MIEIALGLPHLRQGPILRRALSLKATVLVSASALARWKHIDGCRRWTGWNILQLRNLPAQVDAILDSGGFTSHVVYGGFPWSIDDYIALAAAHPFRLFASFDYPCEAEIASDRASVKERLSRTIGANRETRRKAEEAGIADRFMPVLQGRTPADYERCAEALVRSMVPGRTIGVGSMCRREIRGPEGLIAVVEHLDRILPVGVRLHCFGVKGAALPYLRAFEHRVASIDSMAYGVSARREAYRAGISKTDALVAQHMTRWFLRQRRAAASPLRLLPPANVTRPELPAADPWDAAMARAREEIGNLIETGELDHDEITEGWITAWAGDAYADEPQAA
ncbi:hypothetical protein [Novosphingobium sp. HII-3]|uniref:deazapurine DNA modification protein DpdA family protein n=1 Tax=Novosphingobium sp. HII-3 TaxID=2075565 RepID=UPI000CDB52E8|nr:hypothetical protein [Novosphingobium sp. HII-3]